MNRILCLIKNNILVHCGPEDIILRAGTPIALKPIIEGGEAEGSIATIVDLDGNEYKTLRSNLIILSENDVELLLDSTVPEKYARYAKTEEKARSGMLFSSIFLMLIIGIRMLFKSFVLSHSFLFSVLTSFPYFMLMSLGVVSMRAKNRVLPISANYFSNYEDNKKKLLALKQEREK